MMYMKTKLSQALIIVCMYMFVYSKFIKMNFQTKANTGAIRQERFIFVGVSFHSTKEKLTRHLTSDIDLKTFCF